MKKLIGKIKEFLRFFSLRIRAVIKYISDSKLLFCIVIFLVYVLLLLNIQNPIHVRTVGFVSASIFLFGYLLRRSNLFILFSAVVLFATFRVSAVKERDVEILDFSSQIVGKEIMISGYIYSEPEVLHDRQRFVFRINAKNGTVLRESVDIQVTIEKFPKIIIGQKCDLTGDISVPQSSEDFDYASYLLSRQIGLVMNLPNVNCHDLSDRAGSAIQNGLIDFKNTLIAQVDSSLPEPQAGLLSGILFGQKRMFDKDFEQQIRNAGVAHVVAASGYNIAFITIGVDKLLFLFSRKTRLGGMIIASWLYVVIAGFSASIVRAAIMSSFSLVAGLLGSKAFVHEAIPISASLFAFINPYILYDIGFLLSLFATLGLVYLVPVLQRLKLGFSAEPLACLIATMPITISVFGTFSVVSLIANIFIGILLDFTMIIGLIGVAVRYFIATFGNLILLISWMQLKVFEMLISFLGSISFSVVNFDVASSKNLVFVVLLSVVVIAIIAFFPRSQNFKFNYYFSSG